MKLNSYSATGEHAIAKTYVDQSIDEPNLVENKKINEFNIFSLSSILQITLHSDPIIDNHTVNKSYVASLYKNYRNRRNMSTVFNDQDNEFGKNGYKT